ncbi:hypothetical protein PoB_002006000 [Plakobranchus ocellatus]|uniref:Uncharacterized protein n=1 Tax=Plakobranchus ocellatus TaxID=259542 RepID=A0AAV3ZEH4_9GAST|nr:hypothetical protein PoB_002006000 [Plakobranchus ocellatus]
MARWTGERGRWRDEKMERWGHWKTERWEEKGDGKRFRIPPNFVGEKWSLKTAEFRCLATERSELSASFEQNGFTLKVISQLCDIRIKATVRTSARLGLYIKGFQKPSDSAAAYK